MLSRIVKATNLEPILGFVQSLTLIINDHQQLGNTFMQSNWSSNYTKLKGKTINIETLTY